MQQQTTFHNTRAALAEYDRTEPERDALWEKIETETDVWFAEGERERALMLVQKAYYNDTHEFNSYENCMLADLEFMRHVATKG